MIEAPHPYPAWGKLPRKGAKEGTASFHPLCDHMLDVATCFIAIVAKGMRLRSALEKTAGRELTQQDIERLAVLVYLHDLGKANSGFQAKRWKDGAQAGWPRHCGHGAEALLVFNDETLRTCLPIRSIITWGESANDLLLASLSHHGRPIEQNASSDSRIWKPVRDASGVEVYDPEHTLRTIGEKSQRDFPLAFEQGGQSLPAHPAFVNLFAGLVQFADWLASDTQFFKFSDAHAPRTRTKAARNAANAIKSIDLDACHRRHELNDRRVPFENVFNGHPPRPVQSKLADDNLGPLLVLESETGSGKTEAALWRFARLFREGKVDSLYFALPTRVAAVQVYERVRDFATRFWPLDTPVVVRALPGYESADGNEKKKAELPGQEHLWADDPDDQKAASRWAAESPKRFLAASVAVGTIDQILLAGLKVRHAHMRHALLSRSLLVADEVHASDTYMSQLLEDVLRAHLRTGGHALLLSATLGSRQRERFQRIAQGQNPNGAVLSIEAARERPYPLLTDGAQDHALASSGEPKSIQWETLDIIDDPERVARIAVEAAAQGARVLIVRNTVPVAVATQKAVERLVGESGKREWLFDVNRIATLHHSRFSRQDRPLLDRRVEQRIGKRRDGLQACIVVGTQTLEQSLDIDADLLITDICPMDVLLQRIGRLHRHERDVAERPEAYRQARAYVLTPANGSLETYIDKPRFGLGRFKNGGGVYPDLRMIEATRRLIDQSTHRVIPRDNRELVECATHPDCLEDIENELGSRWEKLGQQLEGGDGAKKTMAKYQLLDYGKPFGETLFPNAEERVATRLGAADRLISFESALRGPFGVDVKEIALRHHLIPQGLSPDTRPSDVTTSNGGFEFSLDATRFRYGRFGIEKASA